MGIRRYACLYDLSPEYTRLTPLTFDDYWRNVMYTTYKTHKEVSISACFGAMG